MIDVSIHDRVALLRINRPEKLNALTLSMLRELEGGLRRFGTGADADAIVITGAGRAFCAGDDLKMTEGLDAAGFRALIAAFQALTLGVLQSKILVIGALNGLVVGGAAEWTLCFDARIGCKATEYLFPENNVGLTVTNGASYLLPRLLGGRALSTVLRSVRITCDECVRLGLIDPVVDTPEQVVPKAVELARQWTRPGTPTSFHLKLLRPNQSEMEKAIRHETTVAEEVWERGLPQVAIRSFFSTKERDL